VNDASSQACPYSVQAAKLSDYFFSQQHPKPQRLCHNLLSERKLLLFRQTYRKYDIALFFFAVQPKNPLSVEYRFPASAFRNIDSPQ